ncbi:hypothetical protein FIBSPDRAFT_960920 [Athelia psychrophila]|uniref:Uncharacterized protein n=1 Tax=Athelia psychrophila TaxID=1759441 RepID=A0A166BU81_9AGAM|nr:hypothetical protein FIBSPDRAFT_960920 [Fibularhizoctonia sp. CBS 109695]
MARPIDGAGIKITSGYNSACQCANTSPHPPHQHFNVMLCAPITASTLTGSDAVAHHIPPGAMPLCLAYLPSACLPPCVHTTVLIKIPTIVALGLHPHSTP